MNSRIRTSLAPTARRSMPDRNRALCTCTKTPSKIAKSPSKIARIPSQIAKSHLQIVETRLEFSHKSYLLDGARALSKISVKYAKISQNMPQIWSKIFHSLYKGSQKYSRKCSIYIVFLYSQKFRTSRIP